MEERRIAFLLPILQMANAAAAVGKQGTASVTARGGAK